VRAGNGTLAAAKALGWSEIAAVILDDDNSTASQFAIADNRTAELAEWDTETLASLLDGWDADTRNALGFEQDDIDQLMKELTPAEVVEDEVPEVPVDAVTKPGDLWILGEHRVLCGDSTKQEDAKKLLNGSVADMVFTDPPYALFGNSTGIGGVTDDKMVRPFFRSALAQCRISTKIYGHIYVCCDWHSAFTIEAISREVELAAKNLIVWDKGSGGVGNMYQHCYELVWFFGNTPKQTTTTKTESGERVVQGVPNIWRHSRVASASREHNAAKPVEMISVPINASSDEGDLILDLFLGSGSTLIAAEQLGRKCYGMEISPQYCDVIVKRWETLTGKKAVLEHG
jgi:DNA modification methylase